MDQTVVVPGTEQAAPSTPPPAPETKIEKPSEFSDVHEALEQASKDLAKAPTPPAKVEEKPSGKEEPCKECGKKEEEAEAKGSLKVPFSILDEKGNMIPFKADGKEYVPESLEQLRTWVSMGIHANTVLETAKVDRRTLDLRTKDLEKAEGMLNQIYEAIVSGKIEIRDGKLIAKRPGKEAAPGESGEPPAAEEDEAFQSPESREIKSLKSELAKVKEDLRSMSMDRMDEKVTVEKEKLDKAIEANRKQYHRARDKDIWDLLAMVDGNKQPTYSPETAMKFLHEQECERLAKDLREHPETIKEHPELFNEEAIIDKYLKDKSKREEAPIQGPSGTSAPSPPAVTKKEFKDQHEAMEGFAEDYKEALLAKRNF